MLSIQQVNVGTVLAMTYSDGTVEYRDRTNMKIPPRDSNDRISSLAQVGFSFPAKGPGASPLGPFLIISRMHYDMEISNRETKGLHAVLSPNSCAVVSLDDQHAASMSLLQIDSDYTGSFLDDCTYQTWITLNLLTVEKCFSRLSMKLSSGSIA